MKFIPTTLLAAATALVVPNSAAEATTTTTTTETRNLRGKVVHTRTVRVNENQDKSGLLRGVEPLVDPQPVQTEHHHFVTVRGRTSKGEERAIVLDLDQLEDKLPHDAPIFTKNHHVFQHGDQKAKPGNMRGADSQPASPSSAASPSTPTNHLHGSARHGNLRNDHEIIHHEESHEHHFVGHSEVEREHEHHYRPQHRPHRDHPSHGQENSTTSHFQQDAEGDFDWKRDREMFKLPTGLASHFNETLFDELHDAPFRVYEEALGHSLEEDESFPVFALPQWLNTTGVFTGFSKGAKPLIFENVQFLLHWDEIVSAVNSPVGPELMDHIVNNNFQASLIIGKSVGDGSHVPFIGMVVCYYQFGNPKNVLVPFSKLEDFFDDTSEKHLLDPDTKTLEMAALHEMLQQKRSSTESHFYHPALAHSEERRAQLENLEITHFQKLFQLLIRRSFLFSFGYADCLLNEPHHLRSCLDDTFYNLIKMETSVRGALDDQIVEQLAEINETFHSKVSEACISVQGSGTGIMYGTGSCYSTNDLGAFVGTYGSF